MSKWTIYSRNGVAKYEASNLEYHDTWMGEEFVNVDVTSPTPIDLEIGDYLLYRGLTYTIYSLPTSLKQARRESYGDAFKYDSIKFSARSTELTEIRFFDIVLNDNNLHYTSLPIFSFYAETVEDLLDRIQANIDRNNENKWIIVSYNYTRTINRYPTGSAARAAADLLWRQTFGDTITDNPTNAERKNEKTKVNISINKQNIFDSLQHIKNSFGLNFVTRERTIVVGGEGVVAEHLFQYGKGKGLYEIERTAEVDQQVVTKLFAYGSDKNIPTRYYAEYGKKYFINAIGTISTQINSLFVTVSFKCDVQGAEYYPNKSNTEIEEPETAVDLRRIVTLECEGHTCLGYYREFHNGQGVSGRTYEIHVASTKVGEQKDIYEPSLSKAKAFAEAIQGKTRCNIRDGIVKKDWPDDHISYDTAMPSRMAVNVLMLPGFPEESLANLCKTEYDSTTDKTTIYIRKNISSPYNTLMVVEGDYQIGFSDDRLMPYIMSPNIVQLGVKEGDIHFIEENDDNGLKEVHPTVEGMTEDDVFNNGSDARLDEVVTCEVVTDDGEYKTDDPEYKFPDFHITIPNLGFNLKQTAEDSGGDVTISLTDGYCGGRDFKVTGITQNEEDGTWDLKVQRCSDDTLSLMFPYSDAASHGEEPTADEPYQIRTGDHYVLSGIDIYETTYIWSASVQALRKAITWLLNNDYTRFTYLPKVDEIYMARQHDEALASNGIIKSLHDTLKAGHLMLFEDTDLNIDGSIFIDQITIKEDGNNGIPTYDVVLRNDKQVGSLQRVENQLSSLTSYVNNGGGGLSIPQVRSLIKTYGGELFISKVLADIADGVITFSKGIVSKVRSIFEKGFWVGSEHKHGIDEYGAATLSSLSADDAEEFLHILKSMDVQRALKVFGMLEALVGIKSPNVQSDNYSGDGAFDTGYLLSKYKSEGNNHSYLVVDELFVRIKAIFNELEIRKVSFSGGDLVFSHAGSKIVMARTMYAPNGNDITVNDGIYNSMEKSITLPGAIYDAEDKSIILGQEEVDTTGWIEVAYRCYFMKDDGTTATRNWWKVDDQARCQTFGILEPGTYHDVETTYYWRRVIGVGSEKLTIGEGDEQREVTYDYVDLSIEDCDAGSTIPHAGDQIVQMGNRTDTERQDFIMLDITSAVSPAFKMYNRVNGYSLEGKNEIQLSTKDTFITANKIVIKTDYGTFQQPKERGDWSAIPTDDQGHRRCYYYDLVQHNGATWRCIKPEPQYTTDEPSESSEFWRIYAQKGVTGKGVSNINTYFKASDTTPATPSGAPSGTGWEDDGSSLITKANADAGKHLYESTCSTYTDNTYSWTTPLDDGMIADMAATAEEFALADSATTVPTSGWGASVTPVAGKWIWSRTKLTFKTGDPKYVSIQCVGYCGTDGASITKTSEVTEYVLSTDGVNPKSGQSWSTTKPTPAQGEYVLIRTTITWSDESTTVLISSERNPNDGQPGMDIVAGTTTIQYKLTETNVQPTSGWGNYPAELTQGWYLWSKSTTPYYKGQVGGTSAGESVSYNVSYIAEDGLAGRGISSTSEHYKASTLDGSDAQHSEAAPAGTEQDPDWTTNPNVPDGQGNTQWNETNKYLWNYEKITYTNSDGTTTIERTTPRRIAIWTKNGKGIDSITNYYKVQSDKPNLPADIDTATPTLTGWSTNSSTPPAGQFLWNFERIVWIESDGTNSYTHSAVHSSGYTGTNGSDGYNNAQVVLYQRYIPTEQNPTPALPTGALTYTFSTGLLTPADSPFFNGWSQTPPAADATKKLFITMASACSRAASVSIAASAWATPVEYVADGVNGINSVRIDLDNETDIISLDSEKKVRFAKTVVVHAKIYDGAEPATSGVTHGMTPAQMIIGACQPTITSSNGIVTLTWAFTKGMDMSSAVWEKDIQLTYNYNSYGKTFSLGTTDADAIWQIQPSPSTLSFSTDANNQLTPPYIVAKCGYVKTTGSGTESVEEATTTSGQIGTTGIYLYYRTKTNGSWGAWTAYPTAGVTINNNTTNTDIEFCITEGTIENDNSNILDREVVPVVKDGLAGAPGINHAVVMIYKRAASRPNNSDRPANGVTYTFADGSLSGTLNGWTTKIPDGSNPCWMRQATALGSGTTDTIDSTEWSGDTNGNAIKFVENGAAGDNALDIQLTPSNCIIPQSEEATQGVYPLIYGNAFTEVHVMLGDDELTAGTDYTVSVKTNMQDTNQHCDGEVDSSQLNKVKINEVKKYTPQAGGKSYFYERGYLTVIVTYNGNTYERKFGFACNLLGEWKEETIGDTKKAIASSTWFDLDANGNIVESDRLGTFEQSSKKALSRLDEQTYVTVKSNPDASFEIETAGDYRIVLDMNSKSGVSYTDDETTITLKRGSTTVKTYSNQKYYDRLDDTLPLTVGIYTITASPQVTIVNLAVYYATKTKYSEIEQTVDSISSAVYDENGNSRITQLSNEISMKVMPTIKNAGNRNLFSFKGCTFRLLGDADCVYPAVQSYGMLLRFAGASDESGRLARIRIPLLERGKTYTLSFEAKMKTATANIEIDLGDTVGGLKTIKIGTSWQNYEVTMPFNRTPDDWSDYKWLDLGIVSTDYRSGNYAFLRHVKLEEGDVATAFTIAKEDESNVGNTKVDSWDIDSSNMEEDSTVDCPSGKKVYKTTHLPAAPTQSTSQSIDYITCTNLTSIQAGKVYTLTYWVKSSVNDANEISSYLFPNITPITEDFKGIEVADGQSERIRTDGYTSVGVTTEWKKHYIHFYVMSLPNDGYVHCFAIRLMRSYGYDKNATGEVYVSDPQLIEGYVTESNNSMSEIKQTADQILLNVKNGLSDVGISILGNENKIVAKAGTFEVHNSNDVKTFEIDNDGNLKSSGNAAFSGTVYADSGYFNGSLRTTFHNIANEPGWFYCSSDDPRIQQGYGVGWNYLVGGYDNMCMLAKKTTPSGGTSNSLHVRLPNTLSMIGRRIIFYEMNQPPFSNGVSQFEIRQLNQAAFVGVNADSRHDDLHFQAVYGVEICGGVVEFLAVPHPTDATICTWAIINIDGCIWDYETTQ